MNRRDFEAVTKELLLGDWGEKAYTQPMLGRLWQMVQSISAGEYRQALYQLTLTSARAPTLAQIRAACHSAIISADAHAKSELFKSLPECLMCGHGGWVICVVRGDPTRQVGFICTCPAAKAIGITEKWGASFWRDELERDYLPIKLRTPDLLEALNMQRQAFATMIARRLARIEAAGKLDDHGRAGLRRQLAVLKGYRAKLLAQVKREVRADAGE